MIQQFLIIQTAFIGDVVLATGMIEKLHHYFPDAGIDFLVRKGNEGLLLDHPRLRRLIIWDKKNKKLKNLWKIMQQVRKVRYDKVINLQRFTATGMITSFSGAKQTIGFDKNPLAFLFSKRIKHIISRQGNPRHEIERNNDLIADFTDGIPGKPKLYPSATDFDTVEAYKALPYLTISPASIWFTKQYPKEKWISFIKKLSNQYNVYILGELTIIYWQNKYKPLHCIRMSPIFVANLISSNLRH